MTGCTSTEMKSSFPRWSLGHSGDETYQLARKTLKNPEKTLGAYADWKADVGDVGEARRSYESLLSAKPGNVAAMIGLATVEEKAGRLPAAEAKLLEAIAANPESGTAKYAAAQFFTRHNRISNAVDMLSKAVADAPSDPTYRYALGTALAKNGQVSEGLTHLTMTVGEAEANYNVGYALHEIGKTQAAVPYLRTALKMKPQLKQAQNLLASISRTAQRSMPTIAATTPTRPTPARISPSQPAQYNAVQPAAYTPANHQAAPVTPASYGTSGYRPPQPASSLNVQPATTRNVQPTAPAAQPVQMPQAYRARRNMTMPPAPGLPKINIPTRGQIHDTLRQVSGTYAAPASSGMTPAQLQQLMQATK